MRIRHVSMVCAILVVAATFGSASASDIDQHKRQCSADRAKIASKALTAAKSGIAKAIDTLETPTRSDLARLQRWFGVLSSDTTDTIKRAYKNALGLSIISQIWCPSTNDLHFKWAVGDLAAVSKAAPGAIFLTPRFFELKRTGPDSQIGVLVHELSHRAGIGLKDEVYGVPDAKQLAASNPSMARRNADNYQYYVEDLLFALD